MLEHGQSVLNELNCDMAKYFRGIEENRWRPLHVLVAEFAELDTNGNPTNGHGLQSGNVVGRCYARNILEYQVT